MFNIMRWHVPHLNHVARSKFKVLLLSKLQEDGLKELVRIITLSLAGEITNNLAQIFNIIEMACQAHKPLGLVKG
jgi:hypothetical protein